MCFPVNFAKFLRKAFQQNTSGWLLLHFGIWQSPVTKYQEIGRISYPVLVLHETTFIFVKKNFLLKKDFHDKRFLYIFFSFIKLIKLSIQSGAQRVTTEKYKLGNIYH